MASVSWGARRMGNCTHLWVRGVILLWVLVCASGVNVRAQSSLHQQRVEYREKYKEYAVSKMHEHGIPASITLAQGMLESGNGKSRLAVEGNNHFGIKCHSDWKGKRIYHDDDKRGECFRVYKSPEQSFEDHSAFLRGYSRYAFLFDLDPTDYKGWARGLKRAGYATDPKYAERLIKIIEEEELWKLDRGVTIEVPSPREAQKTQRAEGEERLEVKLGGEHSVFVRNRVEYIVVQPHDTYASLSRAMEMMQWELQCYNELPSRELPPVGTELYIQPKRYRAAHGEQTHVVEAGETLYSISQRYAMKSSSLRRKNRMAKGQEVEPGQVLYLRKKAPRQR